MYRRIRDLREDSDLTQKSLADYLSCSQVCYSNYETGKRDVPSDVLIRLARFYHTSVDYLVGLTEERAPYPKKEIVHSAMFSHGCREAAPLALHGMGAILSRERMAPWTPKRTRGEGPSTPDIGSLNLEELLSLRNQVRCTWLRHELLLFATICNRALLS